jgi:DNA polymerase-3 subunit epsilon
MPYCSDFCAIDFETANLSPDSACAVGLVRVRAGAIEDEFHSLINQADIWFKPEFIDIHGIRPEMTSSAPAFAELWPRMRDFIAGLPLAAHNASFDMNVLRAMLEAAGIEYELPPYMCSLRISRRDWPSLRSHALDAVSRHLGIELEHHDPLSDARACARILLAAGAAAR